jgi:hypothetical protein
MNKKQCKKFIHKYNKEIELYYEVMPNLAHAGYNAIYINPKRFYRDSSIWQKTYLLHEMGHVDYIVKHDSDSWKNTIAYLKAGINGIHEYNAQKWAYHNTKDSRIKKRIIKMFNFWSKYGDAEKYIKYKKAAEIYKENGLDRDFKSI